MTNDESDACTCAACVDRLEQENKFWDEGMGEVEKPVERDYMVTATVQIIVRAIDDACAGNHVKDMINGMIAASIYSNDPGNGSVLESVLPWGGDIQ